VIVIACGCSKNRVAKGGAAAPSGTYRVMVKGRKVYETSNQDAAEQVAARFTGANPTILAPGQSA
jgi:hypothetical protein